ncbi:kinesin-like protein KIF14 isoform X2 [Anabrus simplex]|uniref:kinesin-like protein KIF14 isoform X2 n=1 Tax=Anabrus simplex TaxID=316456 RepID=UPI0035A39A39
MPFRVIMLVCLLMGKLVQEKVTGGSTESGRRAALRVREHPIYGPYVVDLSTHGVVSYEDLQGWLLVGNSQRATAATGMNEKSSRSHSIFSVILTQIQDEKIMEEHHVSNLRSKISLVDLAGSERLSQTCASGDRLREGVSINRSLLTLGKVISALADNTSTKKKAFVPYRDSVLTWLLRESLGGNSRTTMLATISPASSHIEETLATLRYACQVRTIVNKVHINEDPHDRLIRDLRAEVERLRALREEYERQKKFAVPRRLVDNEMMSEIRSKELEIDKLKDQLKQSEEHLSRTHKSWSERLQEAEKCKSAEMNYLRHCGLAVQLNWDQQQPCLVNLNADPILSGTLLYLLPPGTVLVGRQNQDADIALSGPLVNNKHCFIKNEGGKLSLTPVGEGQTFINGKAVSGVVDLHHGDRLVIGGNHFFRVNNPQDQDADTFTQPADYHYAYQEIHEVQENKLREELEEAAKRALKELEQTREEAEKQLGTQRLLYEQQLKHLGSALDQQKDELNEIQKKKEELELQKQVLEAEVESHKTWRNCGQFHDSSFNISPYQSNFLKEIEDALNETICETENILRTSPMTPECCSIGLHDMKVMVQEANQRCKELCIDYEFSRQHRVGQSSLEQTVRVRNRGKCWVAYWKPSYFLQWLERLRLHDPDDSLKELLDVEDEDYWEEDPEDSSSEEDNSLISTKQIKRQLNETIHHLSLESSCIGSELGSPYNNTADNANSIDSSDVEADNYEEMNSCVQQIEEASNKLRKLCEENEVGDVKHTLDALDNMVKQLRTTLHLNSESVLDYDEHHAFKIPDMHTTPNKSNLRSPCLTGVDTPKMHKVVRFQFSDSQRENLKN